eukprot:Rhum_TRINITY_DN9787_c0_g1::Rhum_TRINITY_DN9787_c0_g1_i1::g.34955::m.34955
MGDGGGETAVAGAAAADEAPVGEAAARAALEQVYQAIDVNSDGSVSTAEAKEALLRSGSDVGKQVAENLRGHEYEFCPFDSFLDVLKAAMALEGLTLADLTPQHLAYFKDIMSVGGQAAADVGGE